MIDNDKHRKTRIKWLHCKHKQFRKGSKWSKEAHRLGEFILFLKCLVYNSEEKLLHICVNNFQIIFRFKCNTNWCTGFYIPIQNKVVLSHNDVVLIMLCSETLWQVHARLLPTEWIYTETWTKDVLLQSQTVGTL